MDERRNTRNENGQIEPGSVINPAGINQWTKEMPTHTEIIKDSQEPWRVRTMLDMLYDLAINKKSVKAAELWLSYVIGKPQIIEIDQTARKEELFALFGIKRVMETG